MPGLCNAHDDVTSYLLKSKGSIESAGLRDEAVSSHPKVWLGEGRRRCRTSGIGQRQAREAVPRGDESA